jgi:methionyl-tRNA formyltransferase
MRAVFFGTPEIAVPSLEALVSVADTLAVVCQPDRPSGRGLKHQAPAVKVAAQRLGLEVLQPEKLRDGTLAGWLRELGADVALVMAYGRILPVEVLTAPRLGCLNLHASLLPKLRGAAPIQWAIWRGDTETGVSLMQMDEGLDTGPVLLKRNLAIGPEENSGELASRLSRLAADVTADALPRFERGELTPEAQDESLSTLAPLIQPSDCRVNFDQPATQVARQIRALSPKPGAFTALGKMRLKLLKCRPWPQAPRERTPGVLSAPSTGRLLVTCGENSALEVLVAQLEGKPARTAEELLHGRTLVPGSSLG